MNGPRPLDAATFRTPNRDFGILPFWFLNGELDPDEMLWQLHELRDKGMQGVIFHGRYGLEMPYLGERYLDRIKLGVAEANRLGLAAWIYDEMNWPSGTVDKRLPLERPELAQRYLECVSFTVDGPWFMCLTGEDSRYLDFQRSTPVAVFAIAEDGRVTDLTSNLSFEKVVPWEVPPGRWRLCYLVEKRADYYIDALDPESTRAFLERGYDPYVDALGNGGDGSLVGFYSDEPAMHYFLTAVDNAIVPWTKDMFRRFQERNGYDLRSRLLDLFFDLGPDAARTRHDFYDTTTALYADAYYRQIHDWCRKHDVLFTAHLLYEEWLRQMVRVEGNPFRHYEHMDVVAVDHLYPIIGTREAPDQHVAMKLASSAAHHFGSERLICESFGGIFMDATMQRMKWIADWQYALGVTVVNPHGFHYTFEGARKRDWPPSMFYQYPWWRYYGEFSAYASRVSEMLSGGRHVAKLAVLWPINSMFANYLPQTRTADGALVEAGLNVLTDVLLRLHHDFDYVDEEVLARADVSGGRLRIAGEEYELVVVPPSTHVRAATVDVLEELVAGGGRVLGVLRAPRAAFGPDGTTDVAARVDALLGSGGDAGAFEVVTRAHGAGSGAFVAGDTGFLARGPGTERDAFAASVDAAVRALVDPDVELSDDDLFVVHRRRDDSDVYFVVNTTFEERAATMTLPGEHAPAVWDPTSGAATRARARTERGATTIELSLPPAGSAFVVTGAAADDAPAPVADAADAVSVDVGGPWTFEAEDDNALVLKAWRAAPEPDGAPEHAYASPDVDDDGWLAVVAGAWAYQLAAEPDRPWPIPVWYRIAFDVADVPQRLALLVDGFDGEDARVWLNGIALGAERVRSRVDAQMKELDLTGAVRAGRNVLAVRLVLRGATGGIVDHVKLVGSFELDGGDAGYRLVRPSGVKEPRPWTEQGLPFFSGRGVYRTTFELPAPDGRRALLRVPMGDDVLDVTVNGAPAGVRLWDPYELDVTSLVRAGANELELRVANTPANLLNGVARPSGVAGPPTVVLAPVDSERAP
ncbi:MAG TPA: glycosyl hydrolase [Actinomycetota bacterium]|nr:glycosyl hydrolase [Actinomycetota bacterium]